MTSAGDGTSSGHEGLIGSQTPTLHLAPEWTRSEGEVALDFGRSIGFDLFPWQENFILDGLALDDDGNLASSDVVEVVSRQQGKSEGLELLILYGLFVCRYQEVLYTAHRAETAKKIFVRVQNRIRRSTLLQYELAPDRTGGIRTGNGRWEITLRSGQQAIFRTRSPETGRGLDAVPLLIIDEAQNYDDDEMAALEPVTAAAKPRQIWYAGSAGGPHSTVLGKLVRDAEEGAPRLVYHGWHRAEDDDPGALSTWIKVLPSLGVTVDVNTIAGAHRRWPPSKFDREWMGVGDWPRDVGESWVIPEPSWQARFDKNSQPAGPVVFVPDSTIDLDWSSIAVAGRRADGDIHLEVVAHEVGTAWIAPKLADLAVRHETVMIGVDPRSPSASTVLAQLADLRTAGMLSVPVHEFTAEEVKAAWTWIYTAAKHPTSLPASHATPGFWHRGSEILTQSLATATVRKLLDQNTWSRKGKQDSTPIISATQAGQLVLISEQDTTPPPLPRSGADLQQGRGRTPRRRAPRGETADLWDLSF